MSKYFNFDRIYNSIKKYSDQVIIGVVTLIISAVTVYGVSRPLSNINNGLNQAIKNEQQDSDFLSSIKSEVAIHDSLFKIIDEKIVSCSTSVAKLEERCSNCKK